MAASTMRFPGESAEYRTARNRLLQQEVELRRSMEAVAAARRALPEGGAVLQDYVFQGLRGDGTRGDVRLSELFLAGSSLAAYNFMFPRSAQDKRGGPAAGSTSLLPLQEGPCPSCTAILDQLDAVARHSNDRMNLVVVAKTSLERLLAFGQERGWKHLRLLSSAANTFNRDYGGEDAEGSQQPMFNVFRKQGARITHFWGAELLHAPCDPGQDPRHLGTLEPLWNLFDFTPEGRVTGWDEQLSYSCCHAG